MAFRTAASLGFQEAVSQADAVLQEPIAKLVIT